MPGRHSLFWRLALLVAGFCLAMIWVSDHIGRQVSYRNSFLSQAALEALEAHARQASEAVAQGPAALERWLTERQHDDSGVLLVVNGHLQPL
ncbi:MAG TPA: two-component sensor histidine kinase, partial [Pseudomonas sp.]|nr:two-component sensor histidine kinase [Pseudomonas sp.]